MIFYHGGLNKDFDINNLDLLRKSIKQNNKNQAYCGFYLFDEDNLEKAKKYAKQENNIHKTDDKGVIKIVLNDNLKVFDVPPFSITRITVDQIQRLQALGFDLIRGKSVGCYEYILINKSKIINSEFIELEEEKTR